MLQLYICLTTEVECYSFTFVIGLLQKYNVILENYVLMTPQLSVHAYGLISYHFHDEEKLQKRPKGNCQLHSVTKCLPGQPGTPSTRLKLGI